jgi:hypothetical protein
MSKPSEALKRTLKRLLEKSEAYKVPQSVLDEAHRWGVPIQREHPLHEPPFYYPLIADRFRIPTRKQRERWNNRARAIIDGKAVTEQEIGDDD